jgi:hypothetical protein
MTISESTFASSSGDAGVGRLQAARPLEVERLGDHADRQDAHLARHPGDHRRRAGAGAAAHAGGDEQHVRAVDRLADPVDRLLGAARPASGLAPAPRPVVPSWIRWFAAERFSACASVLAQMKSTPLHALADHVLDGVAAAAAHADHLDLRAHAELFDHFDSHLNLQSLQLP